MESWFCSSKTDEDMLELRDAYKRLLRAVDAMDLHNASVAVELYAFAERHAAVKERSAAVMRNFYLWEEDGRGGNGSRHIIVEECLEAIMRDFYPLDEEI